MTDLYTLSEGAKRCVLNTLNSHTHTHPKTKTPRETVCGGMLSRAVTQDAKFVSLKCVGLADKIMGGSFFLAQWRRIVYNHLTNIIV